MSERPLTKIRMRDGIWEGELVAPHDMTPQLQVTYRDRPLTGVQVSKSGTKDTWTVHIPVPMEAVADGVHCFVITDKAEGTKLGDFAFIAGDIWSADLRGEVELLRAELDMLKRAFRHHCRETS